MAEREISVVMESRYKSDLSKKLRADKQKIDAFQKHLDRRPLRLAVNLDLKGAMVQAQAMRKIILGEFAKMPSSILGADGRPASAKTASSGKSMNKSAGVLADVERQVFGLDEKGNEVTDTFRNLTEQLGNGVTQVNKWKNGKLGETITKDVTTVKELDDALRGMNGTLRESYGRAKGRGDKDGQIAALIDHRERLGKVLNDAADKGLKSSPVHAKAENQIARIGERIEVLNGNKDRDGAAKARKETARAVTNRISDEYRANQAKLASSEIDEAAAKALPVRAAREAELNRIYDERKKLFESSRDVFRKMDGELQRQGAPEQADRAMRATRVQQHQADMVDVERARMESARVIADQAATDKADKLDAAKAERDAKRIKRANDAAAKQDKTRNFGRSLRLDDHATKASLRRNEEQEAAAKALPTQVAQEAELNRVLAERRRIHQDSAGRLGNIETSARSAGDLDFAAKAEAARLRASDAASKVGVSQIKADANAQVSAAKKKDADLKKAAADAHRDREAAFNREMDDIKTNSAKKIANINSTERSEKLAAKNKKDKSAAAERGHLARVGEYGGRQRQYEGVENRARASGHTAVADVARKAKNASSVTGVKDMLRFAGATAKSGHALDFHSNSLIKNGLSFMRWMIPMQIVMKAAQAFIAGFAGALKVDRQFATLGAVFNGTAQEAQALKVETLALAAAQGRSSDEAMDSSIRWSRLGLTRVQVLEATRVSLMAANVAEITAAESAEKLSGLYATYRLNIGDLAGVLNRLNSISNNYNVTVDDLFQGISRVSGVAKSSGLALRDLEGIIGSVVGAGGGSGSEVGNALKFVLTRLGDSEVGEKLKKAFDIDLTGPNGDLKDMSQIMGELAALYPTLNKAEQQHFLQLASGSRQASRFSKVMTEYRQGQILAAKAGYDHAASLRENEKILDSLQSRIDSLQASWTSLFTAGADAGVFDFIIGGLRGIQAAIDQIKGIMPGPRNDGKPKVKVNDPTKAETVENLGGGFDIPIWVTTDFDETRILQTIVQINKALEERRRLIKENADTVGNIPMIERLGLGGGMAFAGKNEKISDQPLVAYNPNTKFKGETFDSVADAENQKKYYMSLLENGGDSGVVDEIAKVTREVSILKDEMESAPRAAGVFTSLGEDFAAGSVDRESAIRQFQSMSSLLIQLDESGKVYNDSLVTFNQLIAAGDRAGMESFLKGLGKSFVANGQAAAKGITALADSAIPAQTKQLAELEARRAKLRTAPVGDGGMAPREKELSLVALDDEIKAVNTSIDSLNAASVKLDDSMNKAFNVTATAQINKYFADIMVQAEQAGKILADLAPDAANDPVARVFQTKRNALEMGVNWLKEIQTSTNAESERTRGPAIAEIERLKNAQGPAAETTDQIAIQQKFIDQQDAADVKAKTMLQTEEERIALLRRELNIQQNLTNLARAQTDAGKRAGNSSRAWRFGEEDSDKDANEAAGAIARAQKNLAGASYGMFGDSPVARASAKGSILQDEATARANLESMERRNYDLDAARKQVAIDTVKAMKEQTNEASKRLMLASREDQLRAAALARTIRDTGPVKDREFFALSQESRQALVNYLPKQAPKSLNEAGASGSKATREINEEQLRLRRALAKEQAKLDKLTADITAASGRGGSLDTTPGAPSKTVQNQAALPNDKAPTVNVSIGDVAVTVKLHEDVERIITGYVDRKFTTELRAMELRLSRPPAPNSQGSVE